MGIARKKPVEVEFIQLTPDNQKVVIEWIDSTEVVWYGVNNDVYINTLEGAMKASENDYIIKGVNGEFYPCKPDIFAKTYDIVSP